MKIKNGLIIVTLLILEIKLSKQLLRSLVLEKQTLQNYCSSLKSCNDCKNGAFQCGWCHDVGCTNFPRIHCPKKFYLDSVLKRDSFQRYCTEIVSKSPIFVPAEVKRIIELDLKINDMTLYERNIVCEISVKNYVIQVKGRLKSNTVYCDATRLNLKESIGLGSVRLIWGGVEPYSNMILIIAYKCRHLAQTCRLCQALSNEFQCGWCKESSICSLKETCPSHYGPWIDKKSSCDKYESKTYKQFKSQYENWYWQNGSN